MSYIIDFSSWLFSGYYQIIVITKMEIKMFEQNHWFVTIQIENRFVNIEMQWIHGTRVCNAWTIFNKVRCL